MKQLFHWNYWYSAREDEIFLDLDSNRAIARALSVLRLSIRKKDLSIKAVWLYGTPTPHHAHMIVVLNRPMPALTKIAWSLWLGNDRLRVAYVLERFDLDLEHTDLLVTKTHYYRKPDALCLCTAKHKEPEITEQCPAMQTLLGAERSADYFTRTGKAPPRRKIRIPWGRISLTQLRNWSAVYERDNERLLQDNGTVVTVRPDSEKLGGPGRENSGTNRDPALAG